MGAVFRSPTTVSHRLPAACVPTPSEGLDEEKEKKKKKGGEIMRDKKSMPPNMVKGKRILAHLEWNTAS